MMRKHKILFALLIATLFSYNQFTNIVDAQTPLKADLIIGQNQQAPPSDAVTSKYGFTLVDELVMGRAVAYNLLERYGNKMNNDPQLNHYVNLVGQSIAKKASNRPQVQYKFGIIDTDEINAFACPGGYVFLTSGLMKVVYDENELAGVLAHEIGHIEKGHGLQDIHNEKSGEYAKARVDKIDQQATLVYDTASSLPYGGWYASYYSPKNLARRGLGRAIGHIGGGYGGAIARGAAYQASDMAVDTVASGLKNLAKKLGNKYYERQFRDPLKPEIEFEADQYSAEALAKTGYDPRGIASFLETIEYIKSSNNEKAEIVNSGTKNMFTYRHPAVDERIGKVEAVVESGSLNVLNPEAGNDEYFETRYAEKLKSLGE